MTEIDLTTGLPEVPEGYFWEVSHTEYKGKDGKTKQDGPLLVSLNTWETSKSMSKKTVTRTWKTLWMVETDVTPAPVVKKKSKRLFSKVMQDQKYFWTSAEKVTARLNGWSDDETAYSYDKMVRNWSPTPDNVRKAALEVVEEFNAKEREKAKSLSIKQAQDTLVGFYPPKKLEGTLDESE